MSFKVEISPRHRGAFIFAAVIVALLLYASVICEQKEYADSGDDYGSEVKGQPVAKSEAKGPEVLSPKDACFAFTQKKRLQAYELCVAKGEEQLAAWTLENGQKEGWAVEMDVAVRYVVEHKEGDLLQVRKENTQELLWVAKRCMGAAWQVEGSEGERKGDASAQNLPIGAYVNAKMGCFGCRTLEQLRRMSNLLAEGLTREVAAVWERERARGQMCVIYPGFDYELMEGMWDEVRVQRSGTSEQWWTLRRWLEPAAPMLPHARVRTQTIVAAFADSTQAGAYEMAKEQGKHDLAAYMCEEREKEGAARKFPTGTEFEVLEWKGNIMRVHVPADTKEWWVGERWLESAE